MRPIPLSPIPLAVCTRTPKPDSADVDLSQREHISPIKWENVLLYGQNLIGRSLIRRAWLATSQYFAPTLTN